jgi:uncharacterized spore protein YtfJ
MTGEEILKTTVDELEKLLTTKNIIGEPIDLGEKTVIPVARYGFGFGGAGGHGQMGDGTGSGAGGGIEPVALIIVHKDVKGAEGIQVLSLRKANPFSEIIGTLSEQLAPRVIEALKIKSEREAKGE